MDNGQGATEDQVKALMWAIIASSNGEYNDLQEELEEDLTPSEVLQAKEMAEKCLASNYKNC